jgi:WD40 repeat protein
VRIWDPATGRRRATLAGHAGPVTAVAIAPDGAWLASGAGGRSVRVWDAATGELRATLAGHACRVRAVAIAPDGAWLASAGDDGSVRIWDPATSQSDTARRDLPSGPQSLIHVSASRAPASQTRSHDFQHRQQPRG